MSPDHDLPQENPEVRHERSDVDLRPILLFGLVMVICGVLINLLISLMFSVLAVREATRLPREYPLAASERNHLPPEPRLQTNPREDLRELRAGEDAVLGSYAWIDRNGGVVRIPISEAMKLAVERGLPSRPAATAGQSGEANSGPRTNMP